MDAQWAYSHVLKSKRIKIIAIKCSHFCSISSNMLLEFNHIDTGYYSECLNHLLILLLDQFIILHTNILIFYLANLYPFSIFMHLLSINWIFNL